MMMERMGMSMSSLLLSSKFDLNARTISSEIKWLDITEALIYMHARPQKRTLYQTSLILSTLHLG